MSDSSVTIDQLERRVARLEQYVEVQSLVGMEKLMRALENLTVLTQHEEALQSAVRERLTSMGIVFREQVQAGPENRFDFLSNDIVVELKVKGGLPALTRQVDRYAWQTHVGGILVVTTKRQHLFLPAELRGKPIRAIWVGSL